MKSLYVREHASEPSKIKLDWEEISIPTLGTNECLIKVAASGVNPSDALAVMGYFNNAMTPRIPGRDFSGTVIDGPKNMIGKKVWGTGGDAGIAFDGTQAQYIKLPPSHLAVIPNNLDLVTAGAQPLPYVTAYYSLVKRAQIENNETVLVAGALGQVGRAAMSICHWKKCQAIALVRGDDQVTLARQLGWKAINSKSRNLQKEILAANNQKPVQVILNSLGNIYWAEFIDSMSESGRIVTISARENAREATINLFDLYRMNQTIIGVNTVTLNFEKNASLLNELSEGFEKNELIPLEVEKSKIYTPELASKAYQEVIEGSEKRVVISFD